jgi:hypothetical protein
VGFGVGWRIHADRRTYKKAGIKVFLYSAKTVSDYRKMAALDPFGVVVDDVAKFQAWRNRQT